MRGDGVFNGGGDHYNDDVDDDDNDNNNSNNNNNNDINAREEYYSGRRANKRPTTKRVCNRDYPATNTYVRYLFDAQLFNVPNNEKQCGFLLTYLHHERIFDVSYVVSVGIDNRLLRASWASASERAAAAAAASSSSLGSSGRASLTSGMYAKIAGRRSGRASIIARNRRATNNRWHDLYANDDDHRYGQQQQQDRIQAEQRCGRLYERLRRGTISTDRHAAASPPMFNGSENAMNGPINPINRRDVRSYMQIVKLSGNPDEDWLDLKIQLCLPSIIIFVKLQGSATQLPSADFTIDINIRELQLLGSGGGNGGSGSASGVGEETLGHKVAMLLAYVRRRYFNVPIPDFEQVQLFDDTEIYDYDDDDDDYEDGDDNDSDVNGNRRNIDDTSRYRGDVSNNHRNYDTTDTTSFSSYTSTQVPESFNRPPPPPSEIYNNVSEETELLAKEQRMNSIREMLGGGTIQAVKKIETL